MVRQDKMWYMNQMHYRSGVFGIGTALLSEVSSCRR